MQIRIKHVTNTWLVALHLFPLLSLFYEAFYTGGADVLLLVPLAFLGILFSLPSFLLCLLLITPVLRAPLPATVKLWAWIIIVFVAILLGVGLICLLFSDSSIFWELMPFTACALLAALLSILLRLRSFFHLIMLQTNAYENDLV